jgi:hypothetical protein
MWSVLNENRVRIDLNKLQAQVHVGISRTTSQILIAANNVTVNFFQNRVTIFNHFGNSYVNIHGICNYN